MARFSRGPQHMFVILGIEHEPGRCTVYAAPRVHTSELTIEQEPIYADFGGPFRETIGLFPPRIDLRCHMSEITVVQGDSFAECFDKLFNTGWTPGDDHPELPTQPALPPAPPLALPEGDA